MANPRAEAGAGSGNSTPETNASAERGRKGRTNGTSGTRAKKSDTASTRKNQALVNIATRRRVGTGAGAAAKTPASAHLGKNLPATNAGDNDADDFPSTMPGGPTSKPTGMLAAAKVPAARVPVSAHTRAAPNGYRSPSA